MRADFAAAIQQRVLVCDGAMGTMLHASGIPLDRALPELNLSDPGLVRAIHDSYLAAGADVIQTNTFGASRLRLAPHGLQDLVREINLAGARIALEARAAAGRPAFVAGSVSPAVTAAQRARTDPEARAEAIREQVRALAEGGVEVLIFETFGYLTEMLEAVRIASSECDLPIVAQMTFTDDGQTLGGESPGAVTTALAELPVTAIGANCTLGPQGLLGIIEGLSRHTTLPLSAQPNAGAPRMAGGRRFQYNVDADYFARYARRYVEAGATLIGGCCGTTPEHIRAAAEAVAGLRPTDRGRFLVSATYPQRAVTTEAGELSDGGLADQLAARRFVVAAEVRPPLGGGAEQATQEAMEFRNRGIQLFTVAPTTSARAQMSPLGLALHLQQRLQVEAILTVTTWDKSIMTLQADLLGAHALGIRSVVCRTGSPPLRGDYPNVDGIWEVDSVGLIELLDRLNHGRDSNGLVLDAATSFYVGARCNPSASDFQAELARTRAKVAAGARFLITRPLYDLEALRRMMTALPGQRVPILLAVQPLRSFSEAEYLRYEVPDVIIPDPVLEAMRRAGDAEGEVGLQLAEELLEEAAGLVEGVVLSLAGAPQGALDRLLQVVARCQPALLSS
ncbi:MAG TPA: bifunctional homocysteine S-methyltransferase/methylenetetrahydrofolate reductase [Candidatus Dormibacteraeota bacterium]|nr:bifunctional homocysteine S-methyltransferase/methylenetetrahydrofolate reductase [Candidatus Dormibacteraeota bacterium]